MYDEYERAVTGKSREGLSFLGWLSIALGTMAALVIVGGGLAFYYVRAQVHHLADELASGMASELAAAPALAATQALANLKSHTHLISADPAEGLQLLQDLGPGNPSEAFLNDMLGGVFDFLPGQEDFGFDFGGFGEGGFLEALSDDGHVRMDVQGNEDGGSLTINSDDGQVRLDLVRTENGGYLAIDSDDGHVRFDLQRTDRGGFLVIDSDDGQVRFDLNRTEDGGSLTINSEEGEVRFDLIEGDDGGQLVIRTPEETIRFAAGDEAESMPRWVPTSDWMPGDLQKVYSVTSSEGFMGAVAWESGKSAEEVLGYYRSWLEGEGYEIRAEHRSRGQGRIQGSLWARNEAQGRMIFLVAEEDAGDTGVLLGYGEEH